MGHARNSLRKPSVLVACASFKGTLTSLQAGRAVARGLTQAGIRARVLALADGGEGLVEAVARSIPGARKICVPCRGPWGERRSAQIVFLPARRGVRVKTAVIEMSASSGLTLLPPARRDPKRTTTLGVGDQIRAALELGARAILLGIGGSATNDGGAGMAQALGARLLDAAGRDLPPGGAALLQLDRIEVSQLDPRIGRIAVTVACDVQNPLCGRRGASAVFGPQKGATPSDVRLLDRALRRWARIIKRDLGKHVSSLPGAGAAGGLGGGSLAFLNARLSSGIDLLLDLVGFERLLEDSALVITGEGRLDRQTLMGKAPAGIARRARANGVPCLGIGGSVERGVRTQLGRVFSGLEDLSTFAGSKRAAQKRAAFWLERLGRERASNWLEKGCGKGR